MGVPRGLKTTIIALVAFALEVVLDDLDEVPLVLDEEFTVMVSLVWCQGARLNTEYTVTRADGSVAATAYSVQMFTEGDSGKPCLTTPELLERCRRRWKAGEFDWLT